MEPRGTRNEKKVFVRAARSDSKPVQALTQEVQAHLGRPITQFKSFKALEAQLLKQREWDALSWRERKRLRRYLKGRKMAAGKPLAFAEWFATLKKPELWGLELA